MRASCRRVGYSGEHSSSHAARGFAWSASMRITPALRRPGRRPGTATLMVAGWAGVAGTPAVPLGVDQFGQSGSVPELYELHDLLPGSIVNAALAALSLA